MIFRLKDVQRAQLPRLFRFNNMQHAIWSMVKCDFICCYHSHLDAKLELNMITLMAQAIMIDIPYFTE
jgi:hypothetical protein